MKRIKVLFRFLAISLALVVLVLNVKVSEAETTDAGTTDPATTEADATTIQPVSLVTGEEDTSTFPSYDLTVPVATKSLVVPINMNYMGQLKINLVGKAVPSFIEIQLYSDEACTSKVGYSGYLDSTSLLYDLKADIPAKGTYYLQFKISDYATTDATVSITPYSFSSANKSLKNKVWRGSHPYTYDSQIAHKITITTPGIITVESASLSDISSVNVALYSSKKVKLSDREYLSSYNNNKTYFAVKKGTYYIYAKAVDDYKLRYTFTAVKDYSNNSKSESITIGKGKTVKGLVRPEDSINSVC